MLSAIFEFQPKETALNSDIYELKTKESEEAITASTKQCARERRKSLRKGRSTKIKKSKDDVWKGEVGGYVCVITVGDILLICNGTSTLLASGLNICELLNFVIFLFRNYGKLRRANVCYIIGVFFVAFTNMWCCDLHHRLNFRWFVHLLQLICVRYLRI